MGAYEKCCDQENNYFHLAFTISNKPDVERSWAGRDDLMQVRQRMF